MENIKRALEHFEASYIEMNKAHQVLACGPASFYFEKMRDYVDGLFGRFGPWKEGDRVRLRNAPASALNSKSHWYSSRHFLVPGSIGTVQSVDFDDGFFCADVIFDDESWIDQSGDKQPVTLKHTYRIWGKDLEKL